MQTVPNLNFPALPDECVRSPDSFNVIANQSVLLLFFLRVIIIIVMKLPKVEPEIPPRLAKGQLDTDLLIRQMINLT